jgi:hypothetical protein
LMFYYNFLLLIFNEFVCWLTWRFPDWPLQQTSSVDFQLKLQKISKKLSLLYVNINSLFSSSISFILDRALLLQKCLEFLRMRFTSVVLSSFTVHFISLFI